jgi:hypothetical protein
MARTKPPAVEAAIEHGRQRQRELMDQAAGLSAEHVDYAEQAEMLTAAGERKAAAAKSSLSRAAIREAIASLQDAVAMHQRATWSAPQASEIAKRHHAEVARLNEQVRAMRRVLPRVP